LIFSDIKIQVFSGKDDASDIGRPVRIKTRYLLGVYAAKPGKMRCKAAGPASVEASEIAVKKTLRVKVDDHPARRLIFSRRTERARRLQGMAFKLGSFKMLGVKLFDVLG
jgi:hypothetical protein